MCNSGNLVAVFTCFMFFEDYLRHFLKSGLLNYAVET